MAPCPRAEGDGCLLVWGVQDVKAGVGGVGQRSRMKDETTNVSNAMLKVWRCNND